jgi:hypothetical protein
MQLAPPYAAVAALKRVARTAADGGVTLGLEVVNRWGLCASNAVAP